MELTIKQLKQHGQIFVPQTTAEAVLVKDNQVVITLADLLEKKIENIITPAGSGLNSYKQEKNVIITHSNSIPANETPSSVKIKYDNRGHIIETSPMGKITVLVDGQGSIQYDGSEDRNLLMGDDFDLDQENKIILKWNHI